MFGYLRKVDLLGQLFACGANVAINCSIAKIYSGHDFVMLPNRSNMFFYKFVKIDDRSVQPAFVTVIL